MMKLIRHAGSTVQYNTIQGNTVGNTVYTKKLPIKTSSSAVGDKP